MLVADTCRNFCYFSCSCSFALLIFAQRDRSQQSNFYLIVLCDNSMAQKNSKCLTVALLGPLYQKLECLALWYGLYMFFYTFNRTWEKTDRIHISLPWINSQCAYIFINHIQWNRLLFSPSNFALNVSQPTNQPASQLSQSTKMCTHFIWLPINMLACLLFIFVLLHFIDNFFLGCLDKFECVFVAVVCSCACACAH